MEDRTQPETKDRRRGDRKCSESPIRVLIDAQEVRGRSDNSSPTGVLFVTEDKLRVRVQFEEDGAVRTVVGRLVRAQRMKGETQGWAVEFDKD